MDSNSNSLTNAPKEIMVPEENIVAKQDPLNLKINEKTLAKMLDKYTKESHDYFKSKGLYDKQDVNKDYLMGRQWDNAIRQSGDINPFMYNIFAESMDVNTSIAFSRVPHVVIKAAQNNPDSIKDAEDLAVIFRDEMRRRKELAVMDIAYKHIPVYYIGAIKPFWNPELLPDGDYDFTFIHPKYLIIDKNANSLDTSKHKMLGHYFPISLEEIEMRFGTAKLKEVLKELNIDKTPDKKGMATVIKACEYYIDWYEQEDDKWKKITAFVWKFKRVILGQMKDPNWDWEGQEHLFTYDFDKMTKQRATPKDMQDALLHQQQLGIPPANGQGIPPQLSLPDNMRKEKTYYNHFKQPRKPLILLGLQQWGEMVYDETSFIEQGIALQDNINVRGRQISQIASNARGRDIFSLSTGLKKKDIENMGEAFKTKDLVIKGNPRETHEHIEGEQPDQALFAEQEGNEHRLFSFLGTNATTRGQQDKNVKGQRQAQQLKESDYGRVDYMVEKAVNFAAEEMADWRMQFIKLRYTTDHFKSVLGAEGQTTFFRIHRDMIQMGMEPQVTASAVDKMMRKQDAFAKAKLKIIDPLTFFEDIDDPNPKQRAERWFLFESNKEMWYMKYVKGQDIPQMAQTLGQQGAQMQQTAGVPPVPPQQLPLSQPQSPTLAGASQQQPLTVSQPGAIQ